MGGMRGATVLVLALAVLAGCGGTRAADQERREPQGVVYALTDLGRHTPEFGT